MELNSIKNKVTLSNGVKMPILGLGLYKTANGTEVENAMAHGLDAGYRLFDTASFYANEEGVGKALRQTAIPREDIFITSKLWNSDQGFNQSLKAFETSLQLMKQEYMDLYLIHWPLPEKIIDTWRALEKLYETGKVRAIGVSNFTSAHLETLMAAAEVPPMVNQVEFHPRLQQDDLQLFCRENNIQFQAWSPLAQGDALKIGEINCLAEKYGKSESQIILRWMLQKGISTIPKSVHKWRIFNNADVFTFELSKEDMEEMDRLDKDERIGPHPDHVDF